MIDFGQLVERESRGLVAAVTAIVGDRHRAEEIVQDAFERCYRRWRRVSRMDRPGAWVRRVAINAAISASRRSASERRAVERLASRDASPVSWDPIGSVEDAEVWAVVRSLPGEQAAAVALRYGADLSLEEVAATMEITPSAARSLLHRARRTLRERPDLLLHADRIRGAS